MANRRNFLWQLLALCSTNLIGWKSLATIQTDQTKLIVTQQKRIKAGLASPTSRTCQRIATKIAPRTIELVKDPGWEGLMYKAIADELKAAGLYPEVRNPESQRGSSGSVGGPQPAAATLPALGPVVAAVLLLIAAVLVMIEEIVAKEK